MMDYVYKIKNLILSKQTGEWCRLKYHNHPKGCPAYGKKDTCPPNAPHITEFFDISKPIYIIHSEFDLAAHISKMFGRHPDWTLKQAKCVLYWQPTSRKLLKERILVAMKALGTERITTCPEAMGVNVYATALKSGLKLEKIRDLKTCRHVALIGFKPTT